MEHKTRYVIGIVALSVITIALIIALVLVIVYFNTVKGNIDNGINAIVCVDGTILKAGRKELILEKGKRVKILQDDILNNIYLVKCDDVIGKVPKESVVYYKNSGNKKYSLMVDVSQFNIVGKESEENPNRNFNNEEEFGLFMIENNIDYAYIRLGGRGWGQKGTLYYDDEATRYIDICEYLGIPYGFYFLDEALNYEEIIEEVNFVKDFLDKNKTKMNKLPLAIDLEYQSGKGRTDETWEGRTIILNTLIYEFNKINVDCIIYTNGARGEKYLKDVNTKFWVAMYPQNDIIPENNYKATVKMEQLENELTAIVSNNLNTKINKGGTNITYYTDEFLDKVIGWQFTESGAELDGIDEYIDLSIINSKQIKQYFE